MGIQERLEADAKAADELILQQNEKTDDDKLDAESKTDAAAPGAGDKTDPLQAKPEPKQEEGTWRAKYFVLEGKYAAEVPRLNDEVKRLKTENDRLLRENDELRRSPPEDDADASKTLLTGENAVRVEDYEDYGEEIQRLAETVSRLERENADLKAQRAPAVGQEVQTGSQTAAPATPTKVDAPTPPAPRVAQVTSDFATELSKALPGWQQINQAAAAVRWFDEADPASGMDRQSILDGYVATGRVDLVADMLREFQRQSQGGSPNKAPASEIEKQVEPSRRNAGGEVPSGKKMWTDAEIKAFYADLRKGKYATRQAEADAIEKDIVAAPREGRYRP